MAQALLLETERLALDLHALLKEIDPARWKDELASAVRKRLSEIEQQLRALLDQPGWPSTDALEGLRERLDELAAMVRAHCHDGEARMHELQDEWAHFRGDLQQRYEGLASSLRRFDIHVPSLRPTNYVRNIFHVGCATLTVLLIEQVLQPSWMLWAAGVAASFGWFLEGSRRVSSRMNQLCMWVFKTVAHPHEAHRINSSTWYTTALFLVALTGSSMICATAVAVLGLADPAAAVVGRRWGRTRLVNGRSLQGSLTFFIVGVFAVLAVLFVWHPQFGAGQALVVATSAALAGAVAELFSRRIDDNLSIPVTVGASAWLAALALGVPL